LNGGIFSILWTPPKEGRYIITAVFPGSKSYWDSYASTAIGVVAAAPSPTAAVEALQPWNIILTVIVVACIILQFRIDKVYPGRHAAWAFLGKLHRQNNQA